MTTKINYDLVEKECMKVLLLNPNKSESYNSIFNKISEKDNIKSIIGNNPILLEELKIITYDVVNHLSIRQNNVVVSNNNGILKACYTTDSNTIEDNDIVVNESKLETDKDKDSISIISVIEFILINKLEDHYYRQDHLGNTILHYLILHNRLDYIKKYFDILMIMINTNNNNDNTPIDLIKSIEISNFFLKYMINKNQYNVNIFNNEMNIMNIMNNKISNQINKIINIIIMIMILFIIVIYNLISII